MTANAFDWNAVVEATGIGIWEWNLQTGAVACNDAGALQLGYTRAELERASMSIRGWSDLAHPSDAARAAELLAQHLAGATDVFACEGRVRHADGRWVWLDVRGRVMSRTADGKPEWMCGTHFDITRRRRREDALGKSRELLHRTGMLAGVGGWEYDVATGDVTWSDGTNEFRRVPPGERGSLEEAIAFYAPEAQERVRAAVAAAIATGERFDLELPFVDLDNRRGWMRTVGGAEFVDGVAVRLTGAFQDITQRVIEREALRVANERIALATEAGGIGIWERDIAGGMLYWNAPMYRLFGLDPARTTVDYELWRACVHPDDRDVTERAIADAIAGRRPYDIEYRIVWPDGSIRHLRGSGRIMSDADGTAARFVGAKWDITEPRRLAAELAAGHEHLRVTLQSIGDAVITTDAHGTIVWLNPVAEHLTGWSTTDAVGQDATAVFRVVNEDSREAAVDPIERCLSGAKMPEPVTHVVLLSRDGSEYGIEASVAPIRGECGDLLGAVLVFHDVTEARRLSGEMRYRASHDALTGLVNRAEGEHRLRRLLHRAHEERSTHALLFIDLDHFKAVNDACGHAAGDALLQQIAKLIASGTRSRDTLARLGGDEFAIILDHCSVEEAQRLAAQVCDRIDRYRYVHEGRSFRVGASIGVVPVDDRWATASAILAAADAACYAAKSAGRNRVHTWLDTDLASHTRHRERQWIARIGQALAADRFALYAQRIEPLRAAPRGVSAEVLLRLVDADGALIPPGAFFPAAERFGLASRIDRWVLTRVLAWLRRLPSIDALDYLGINLTQQSVGDRSFHAWTLATLAEAGPDLCARLGVEITESAALTNLPDAVPFVEGLRRCGARVALDAFGGGASSFTYLKTLPVDLLKIDGRIVRDMLDDRLTEAGVRSLIDVAGVIDARTVASCVESPALAERCSALGIDFAQGFEHHRPRPLEALLDGSLAIAE